MYVKKLSAFTLAETLVTLMIIGVIASMTIPGLKRSSEQRELAAKAKKTFSTLSQATDLIIQEEGAPRHWDKTQYMELYKKQLNVMKDCPTGIGCYYNGSIKMVSGVNDMNYAAAGKPAITLADGTHFFIIPGYGSLNSYGADPADYPKIIATMQFDVNGDNKPNQWGVDNFGVLLIDGKGLLPFGYFDESKCKNVYGCTSSVLREGKLQ